MTYASDLQNVVMELMELLERKHHDYGPDNLKRHGLIGIMVRIDDKSSRLQHILGEEALVVDETVEDTFLDIAGYALQGILLNRGKL